MDTLDTAGQPDPILDSLDLPESRGHVQIKDMSVTHDMIINWLLTNPQKSQRECADHFGYTQPWLSTLIHTDMFQAKLKERQEAVFNYVASDIPAKLAGLADLAVDKLSHKLADSENADFILDSFDKIMHRAGYAPASAKAPAGTQNTQINIFTADKDSLALARARMQQRTLTASEEKLVQEVSALPDDQLPDALTIEN